MMGGDRELVLCLGLVCAALIFSAFTWYAFIVGVVLWFSGLALLRKAGKSDPLMRHVGLKSYSYKRYYPARATPYRENTPSQGKVYQ